MELDCCHCTLDSARKTSPPSTEVSVTFVTVKKGGGCIPFSLCASLLLLSLTGSVLCAGGHMLLLDPVLK